MDASTLNKELQEVIKNSLPAGKSIAAFLMDVLKIGKEATYRRLRGEVPLSLHETYLIVKTLGISLDYIIKTIPNENHIFELIQQHYFNLRDIDYKTIYTLNKILKQIKDEPESEFVISSNVFPQIPIHISYLLSKYNSFRWIYRNQKMYTLKPFREIDYPDDVYVMYRNTVFQTMNIKKSYYIWDSMIFAGIVNEIKYFSGIYLINDDDIIQLKEELHNFLFYIENIAKKGVFDTGNKVYIYITNINSDTSYGYLETNHLCVSMIGAFAHNYLVSYDRKALDTIKETINSLKRVSTLISGSGEMYRSAFFKNQHDLVDTL